MGGTESSLKAMAVQKHFKFPPCLIDQSKQRRISHMAFRPTDFWVCTELHTLYITRFYTSKMLKAGKYF